MKFKLLAIIFLLNSIGAIYSIADHSVLTADEVSLYEIGLGDIARSSFLFIGGAWLAHKQLPRLAGQQIEYNAPIFTKIFASLLFTVGTIGGVVGAYQLSNIIYARLNRFSEDR